jgi:hypothetical protein
VSPGDAAIASWCVQEQKDGSEGDGDNSGGGIVEQADAVGLCASFQLTNFQKQVVTSQSGDLLQRYRPIYALRVAFSKRVVAVDTDLDILLHVHWARSCRRTLTADFSVRSV